MAIPINKTGQENTHWMLPGSIFFSNWRKMRLHIGSAHGEMLMEFISKNKIKSNFSTNLYNLRGKK